MGIDRTEECVYLQMIVVELAMGEHYTAFYKKV